MVEVLQLTIPVCIYYITSFVLIDYLWIVLCEKARMKKQIQKTFLIIEEVQVMLT